MAASTSDTWLLGSPPNSVEAPEKSLEWEDTWAWISMPTTISQSPVAPLMSLDALAGAFMDLSAGLARTAGARAGSCFF